MSPSRLLYISALHVTLYRWIDSDLEVEARFSHDEAGIEAFDTHIARLSDSDSVVHVLVDIVEEAFQLDVIPFVRGSDRKALLGRRLAQRFRDVSLATTSSLGYERTQRREERVLLSAFTNIEFLEPWLAALAHHKISVSGIFSPGLLGPAIARALALNKNNLIVVSVQEAGLRQTYIENGKLRFSRLSPLSADDLGDRERLGIALGTETGRVYQYLRATNVLGIDHAPIDVAVIAPPGQAELAQRYMPELPQLQIKVVDQRQIATSVGLRMRSQQGGAESLFLALLAQRRPTLQYGPALLRKKYRDYQARIAILLGGALVGLACLVAAAATWWASGQLEEAIADNNAQIEAAQARYQKVEASFPRLPTTRDKLRAAMQQYSGLLRLPSGPEGLAVELSAALDASPRVEMQKMRWHINSVPAAAGAPGATPGKPGGARYEVLEIDASLNGVPASDYRAANLLVEVFIDELKKIPQIQIVHAKMPFETGSQESLSAQLGQTPGAAGLRFNVIIARRIGV